MKKYEIYSFCTNVSEHKFLFVCLFGLIKKKPFISEFILKMFFLLLVQRWNEIIQPTKKKKKKKNEKQQQQWQCEKDKTEKTTNQFNSTILIWKSSSKFITIFLIMLKNWIKFDSVFVCFLFSFHFISPYSPHVNGFSVFWLFQFFFKEKDYYFCSEKIY